MGSIESIVRYLNAQRPGISAAAPETEPRLRPFVTISRKAGSGGHSLADALLDLFERQEDTELFSGWQVFDQQLCEIVARDQAFSQSLDSLLMEEYRTTLDDFFHQVLSSSVDQDYLMARVFKVVRAVASIGKAVIVGRGGSQVTKDMGLGVRVRIVAPEEKCIQHFMEADGLDERRARAHVRKLDGNRARLLKTHFRVDIDDPTGYDAVWNTGSASVEDIAAAITAILRVRASKWQAA